MTMTATASVIPPARTRNAAHGEKLGTYALAASSSLLTTRKASLTNALLGGRNSSISEKPSMHSNLGDAELAVFRTRVCEQHRTGNCHNADRCPHSHCQTWQRRNPNDYNYSAKLCPEIEFVKKGSKMTLLRRCSRGRACAFAHSKEEELYHPTMYKTKMCNAHPSCTRYFCPFAHCEKEIRRVQASPRRKGARGSCAELLTQKVESRGCTNINSQRANNNNTNNLPTTQRGLRRRATSPGQPRMDSPASRSRTQSTHNANIAATWRHEKSGSLQGSGIINRLRTAPCPYIVSISQKEGNPYSSNGNNKNSEFLSNGSNASPFFMSRDTNTRRHTITAPQREKGLLHTWKPQQSSNYPNSPLSSSSTTAPSSVPSPLVAGLSPLSHHLPLNDVLGHATAASSSPSFSPAASNVARASGVHRATELSCMEAFASYSSYLSALEELLKITLHNGSTNETESNNNSFSLPLSSLPDIANWNGTDSAPVALLDDGVTGNNGMNQTTQDKLQKHGLDENNNNLQAASGSVQSTITTGGFQASGFVRPSVENAQSPGFSTEWEAEDQLCQHSALMSMKDSTEANEELVYSSHCAVVEDVNENTKQDVFESLAHKTGSHDWLDLLSQRSLNQNETLSFSELKRRLLHTATVPNMNQAAHNSKHDALERVTTSELCLESLPASFGIDKNNFSSLKTQSLDEGRRGSAISDSYYLGSKYRPEHYSDSMRHLDQEDRELHNNFEHSYVSLTEAQVKPAAANSLHIATKLAVHNEVKEQFSKICHVGPETVALRGEKGICTVQGSLLLPACSTGEENAPNPDKHEDRIASNIGESISTIVSPTGIGLSFGDSFFCDMKLSKASKTMSRSHADGWRGDEDVSGQKDRPNGLARDKMVDIDCPIVSFSDASEQTDSVDSHALGIYSSNCFGGNSSESERGPYILNKNARCFSLFHDQPELFQKDGPPTSRHQKSPIFRTCQKEILSEKQIAVQWTSNAEFCLSGRLDETFDDINDQVQEALGKQDGAGSVGESVSVASTECISRQSCEIGTDGADILYSRSGTSLWPFRRESQSSYTSAATSGDTFQSDYIGMSSKASGVSGATPSIFKEEIATGSVQDCTRMEFQNDSDGVKNNEQGFLRAATCESDWRFVHNMLGAHALRCDQSTNRKRVEEFSSQCASTKASEGCRSFSSMGVGSKTCNSCSSPAGDEPTLLASHTASFDDNGNVKDHHLGSNSEGLSSLLASARRSREKSGYSRSVECSTSNPTMSFQGFASPFGFDSLLEVLGSGTTQTVLSTIADCNDCVTKAVVDQKLCGVINAAERERAVAKARCAPTVSARGCGFVQEPHELGEDENRQSQGKCGSFRLLGRLPPVSQSTLNYQNGAEASRLTLGSHAKE